MGGACRLRRAREYDIRRQFNEGMRARVRTDDGQHKERSNATQGLHQGCMLSSLLLKVFFKLNKKIMSQLTINIINQ